MIRDILNYNNEVIGTLELPNETTEQEWQEKLLPYAVPPVDPAMASLAYTIQDRKQWADAMMGRFKQQNISQGINGLQAMWLHHRMRSVSVTFYGVPMIIDMLNLVVSGDIEVACLTLQLLSLDDMTQPFHWLNEDRRTWMVNECKTYLGWA